MDRSDLLREVAIRTITQAFISIFTAWLAAFLAVCVMLLFLLTYSVVREGSVVSYMGLAALIVAVAIASLKTAVPIWLFGNLMLALSCKRAFFRHHLVWLCGSLIFAPVIAIALEDGLSDQQTIFMLILYSVASSFIFRLLTLRLALGIWADLPTSLASSVTSGSGH